MTDPVDLARERTKRTIENGAPPEATLSIEWWSQGESNSYSLLVDGAATNRHWLAHQLRQIATIVETTDGADDYGEWEGLPLEPTQTPRIPKETQHKLWLDLLLLAALAVFAYLATDYVLHGQVHSPTLGDHAHEETP